MSLGNASGVADPIQILIVEDNRPDIYLLKLAVTREHLDCVFHVAETGADAFRFLRREPPYADTVFPDLVILDLNVPLKNGEEVLHLIRTTEEFRRLTVVVCSSSSAEIRFRSDSGPDACVAKPTDLDSYMALGKEIMDCYWRKRVP